MPLVSSVLGAELANMAPVDNEPDAINNFAAAWETYFKDAAVLGVPTTPGSLSGAIGSMKGALVGMSATGAGAAKIAAGITAFWSTVAGAAATIWVTAPPPTGATPPPGLGGIAAALSAAFAANMAGDLALADAANAVAAAIHPTQLGGIALVPPPPAGPGPSPIL